jgi:hypothetical protein
MSFVELAAAVGIIVTTMLAIIAFLEKTTKLLSRWQGKVVENATKPLREDVQELRRFSQFHLGPNGSAKQLWVKVDDLVEDFRDHIRRDEQR